MAFDRWRCVTSTFCCVGLVSCAGDPPAKDAGSEATGDPVAQKDGSETSEMSEPSSSELGDWRWDVPPSDPQFCVASGPPLNLEVQTPAGPRVVNYASWDWGLCCGEAPYVLLHDRAELMIEGTQVVEPYIVVDLAAGTAQEAWGGATRIVVTLMDGTDVANGLGSVDLHTAVSLGETPATLAMTFALDFGGWEFDGTLDAQFCPALDRTCVCE